MDDVPFAPPPLTDPVGEEAASFDFESYNFQTQVAAGVELVVRGLEQTSSTSAVRQLAKILHSIYGADP
ncbi:hypothetical protein H0H92_013513, partial [Tricholoma furcatifolium]